MNWSVVKCQYEGGGYGLVVDILVETEDIIFFNIFFPY